MGRRGQTLREQSLEPASIPSVSIGEFWEPRRKINREKTLWNQYRSLDDRLDNFRRAAGISEGQYQGPYHNDPPVYKWIEAASYALPTIDDEEELTRLEDAIDDVIELVAAAQQRDGYLHTKFILEYEPEDRWTNLHRKHELFAAGHLFESAVAHAEITGDHTLLDVAIKFADHIDERFGPDKNDGYPGHQEIELGLVRLYRATGEERYLDLAQFFLDARNGDESRFEWELDHPDEIAGEPLEELFLDENGDYDGSYAQDHAPVREQETAVGHAVRALFQYTGMVDVAVETGDESLFTAADRLWENVTQRRMYITGGVGARAEGEAFGEDYELPNDSAYSETCGAVANVIWNQRMLNATGDGRYGDVMERALYNNLLAGVSLDGSKFTYTNPLAHDEYERHRQDWFNTVCCPPNVARLLASLERYCYSVSETELYVNLYAESDFETTIDDTEVVLDQSTDYPWDGEITIDLSADSPADFDLALRMPGWCRETAIEVNGEKIDSDAVISDGYAHLDRTWTDGDTIDLELSMPVERVRSHPKVEPNQRKVALQRGPLIYAFEATDNSAPIDQLCLPSTIDAEVTFEPDLLDGIAVIEGDAMAPDTEEWEGDLYRVASEVTDKRVRFRAVPYYAWDNRDPGPMRVWVWDGSQ